MDTSLLKTFLSVARWNNFTAAADELHLAQSTVTARVKLLERELGAPLFERTPTGAHLTEAAKRVHEQAQQLLDLEHSMALAVRGREAEPQGDVVVGAPESICAYRLPSVIAEVREQHPRINLHLVPSDTRASLAGVSDRSLDIGLVVEEVPPASRLDVDVIGYEQVAVFAAQGHPLTQQKSVEWSELSDEVFYLLEDGCGYSDALFRDLSEGLPRAPRVTRFGSIEAARACVEAGLGLAVLPVAACMARSEGIARVPGLPRPDYPLRLVVDPRRAQSRAVQKVSEVITSAAAEAPSAAVG